MSISTDSVNQNRNIFDVEQAKLRLSASQIGNQVIHFSRLQSTMTRAREIAETQLQTQSPLSSGLAIVADLQTAGRGRLNRKWVSPVGTGLLMSVLLGPDQLPSQLYQLPMLVSVTLVNAIIEMYPASAGHVKIKWPNDILLGDTPGKVAGILIESAFGRFGIDYSVVGIGVNVNQTHEELPPAEGGMHRPNSLRLWLGEPADRTELFIRICQQLEYQINISHNDKLLFENWKNLLCTLGQPITISTLRQSAHNEFETDAEIEEQFTGTAVDVNQDGTLIVENAHGCRRAFASGQASLRPDLNKQSDALRV